MFDLTKEIKLPKALQKKYAIARTFLHVVFVFSAGFVAYRILFPIVPLDFSMASPNSSKNSLGSPRAQQTNQFPEKRTVGANQSLIFNANPVGQFSQAQVSFTLDKNGKSIENSPIKIQKSYQAFFYPQGQPVGFKNGALLSTPNGNYYIISDGMLRKFASTDIILQMGYPKSAFVSITQQDLKFNQIGSDVVDAATYPSDTLFAIDENFYQLKDQKLFPFVSARAFTSQFDPTSAIVKNADFLSLHPAQETTLGFADGSLLSSADSVFIISEGKSFPLETAETFLAMGFSFDDVLAVTQDEINAHKKQKQFTHNDPHPNGIVFLDQKTNKYFVIKDGFKLPLPTENIAKAYLAKQKPIVADSTEAQTESSCTLKKNLFSSNAYSCSVSLENLSAFIGNDFQVSTNFSNGAKISTINTTFSTPLEWKSLMMSLSKIKERIVNR